MSRVSTCWAALCAASVVFFVAIGEAQAYPWMIRHGYSNCGACHADPSGGELLTPYGHAISYEVLSTRFGGSDKSARAFERRVANALSRAASSKHAQKKDSAVAAAEEAQSADDAAEEGAEDPGAKKDGKAAAAEEESEAAEEEEAVEEEEAPAEESESAASAYANMQPQEEQSPYKDMNPLTGPLFGLLSPKEDFLLGGSIRLASLYKFDAESDKLRLFPMQADAYGQVRFAKRFRVAGSLGVSKVPAGSPHSRAAQITRAQDDAYNLISRTHWVGFELAGGAHLLRAGRLNLPFGVRIPEHTMWIRERTQTDRESDQQHGVALYMGWDSVRFELMGIAGNYQVNPDKFRERGYSGYIEYMIDRKIALGASSLLTIAKDDRLEPTGQSTTRQAHGVLVRASASETISFLVEADMLLRSRRDLGYVGFLQVDVEPVQGFHIIGTGEMYDIGLPDNAGEVGISRSAGFGRPQAGGWFSLQWFFLPHFDVRADLIQRQDTQLLAQLHVYL